MVSPWMNKGSILETGQYLRELGVKDGKENVKRPLLVQIPQWVRCLALSGSD